MYHFKMSNLRRVALYTMFPIGILSIYLAIVKKELEDMSADMYFTIPIGAGFIIAFSQKIINGNLRDLGILFNHIEK